MSATNTFREYLRESEDDSEPLNEFAIVQKGNLKDYGEFITTYKKNVVDDFMKLIDKNIKISKLPNYTFELYQFTNRKINEPDYILGFWVDEENETKIGLEIKRVFKAIFAIQISKSNVNIGSYSNIINVDGVFTAEDRSFRSKGIATFIYIYLVNNLKYTILGDIEQYFGARKLWVGLSKIKSFQVDIIDTKTNRIIFKDIILKHGELDAEFGKRLWDSENSKSYISLNYRCILTKINQ